MAAMKEFSNKITGISNINNFKLHIAESRDYASMLQLDRMGAWGIIIHYILHSCNYPILLELSRYKCNEEL